MKVSSDFPGNLALTRMFGEFSAVWLCHETKHEKSSKNSGKIFRCHQDPNSETQKTFGILFREYCFREENSLSLGEFWGKLGEFCEKLGEFALSHK